MEDLPIEIIQKILTYLDWRSINNLLSCNTYFLNLRNYENISKIFLKSYFGKLDTSEICVYSNLSGYFLTNYLDNLSYYDLVKGKIHTCENNKIYSDNIINSLDYIIDMVNMMNNYVEKKNVEVSNINYINLDFFNNFLIENIHNYTIFLNDYKRVSNILNKLLKFNVLILSTDIYGNLYSEVLLKNIPYFIYTVLENKFLKSDHIIQLLSIVREYYLIDYKEEFINNSVYDKLHCYLHALTTCTFSINNTKKNIDDYICDIENILLISKSSFFSIQIVKDCLYATKYICYYCKNIEEYHKNNIIKLIEKYCVCKSTQRVALKTIINIISYIDITNKYLDYILCLIILNQTDIYFISLLSEIIELLLVKNYNNYKEKFLSLANNIINNQGEIIGLIKNLYYSEWLINREELLAFYYHKTDAILEKEIIENMCYYIKSTKKLDYYSLEIRKNNNYKDKTIIPNEFDRSVEYLFN